MLRIRKILLRGNSVQDAYVDFYKGANILAGESDTGKSYLVSCLDYILGAEKLKKKLKEATDYTHLYVEFENDEGGVLTLKRGLEGGKLEAHDVAIQDIHGEGKIIAPVRKGTSKGPDVTLKWSTKTGHRVRVFSSIDFPIRLVVTHHYIRAVLVRCNIQRY
ncbi:ATP-binding protein, partial [Escherichia coli]